VPPNPIASAASFWLYGAQSNLMVVLSQHLPLPDLTHYDYISQQPCTNQEILMMVTNTTPFAIQSNRWYVGVFATTASNAFYTNIPFVVEACNVTNYPVIIPLTNGIPFIAGPTNPFGAPPGPPRTFYFEFDITNDVGGVLFEMHNLTGDADLVLERDIVPTMAPYFDGSYQLGTDPEQIVVRPSYALPSLRGRWFLGVYNNEATNVGYTIRAVLPNAAGLLVSAQPLQLTIAPLQPPHGVLLSWNGVVGETYLVQHADSLRPPIQWTTIGVVVATTPCPTFEVPAGGFGFYRIVQSVTAVPIGPTLKVQLVPGGRVRLSWSILFPGYTLQYKIGFGGAWVDAGLPVTVEGAEFVVYDTLGPGPKFYRLAPP
jgi:hypothetical protein